MTDASRNAGRLGSNTSMNNGGPLKNRCFLLEIDDNRVQERISTAIRRQGGSVVYTIHESTTPAVVVSDHSLAFRIERKQVDVSNPTANFLRVLPALLREAVKRGIKVRTAETFMKQLENLKTRTQRSSSTSNSIQRQFPSSRKSLVDLTSSFSSANDTPCFIRIDPPRRRPEIKFFNGMGRLHCGYDAGYSVLRKADDSLDEEDTTCTYCNVNIVDIVEHEKSDAHRKKLYRLGIMQQFERVVMSTRLEIEQSARHRPKTTTETSSEALAAYEYGENQLRLDPQKLSQARSEPRPYSSPVVPKTENDSAYESAPPCSSYASLSSTELDLLDFIGQKPFKSSK
ncbi:unnamed protein product [Caenorhabditis auriculariae]|uniref:DBF4-type domain-containing protein n=1 Tax=Caenorhabditis auriculariae TaxID=2777116 RepID=A0A8S1H4Q3_9PELO|nr:unnamed protein product [Caenorhabditis auriculariae]